MLFTGLHRALGTGPGPITSEMVDQAVRAGVIETDDLDWKSELPPAKDLSQTDFPKDVAAMANSGGGILVFGVKDAQKAATKRLDVGSLSEAHERALRSVAVTAVSPPIFGLEIVELGGEGSRVVAVVVPASVDVPHLIYRNDYFGAPIRNNADTVWMRERRVEAMYRARFAEQRSSDEALTTLHANSAAGRDSRDRAWFIGVARPRVTAAMSPRLSRDSARFIVSEAFELTQVFVDANSIHPIANVSSFPRPGLRSWVFGNRAEGETRRWREAWISLHDDGSVTVAAAIGGQRTSREELPGDVITVDALEAAVADLMSLLKGMSSHITVRDYDLRVDVEWAGDGPMQFVNPSHFDVEKTADMAAFTAIAATVQTDVDADDYYDTVYDVVCDAANQAGVQEPTKMRRRATSAE